MNKKTGAAPATPSQTVTSIHNRHDGFVCQVQVRVPASIKTRPVEKGTTRKGYYEPIATSFKHDGFNYRQIAREGDIAIYEQKWTDCEDPSIAYEVIRIQRHEAKMFPSGKSYPAREAYPPSGAWGTDGFTLTDRDAAFNKFQQIVAGRTGKTNLEQAGDGLEQEQTETSNTNSN